MIEVVRSRTIDAPPDVVWGVLAAFGDIADWASNADHSCLLNEPGDDGNMLGVTRRIQAGRYVLVETVTEWEPPHRLAYTIAGMPPVLRSVVNEWQLTAPGGASTAPTDVALVTHIDCGPRPPQQLIARLAGRRLAKASETMLRSLDERCTGIRTTGEGTT